MADPSFDVVSEVSMPEVVNAVAQAQKEVVQRFDLKGTAAGIELKEKEKQIVLTANDDFGLKAVNDVLQNKLIKRNVALKSLVYGTVEPAVRMLQGFAFSAAISGDSAAYAARGLANSPNTEDPASTAPPPMKPCAISCRRVTGRG